MRKKRTDAPPDARVTGILGVGLDNADGKKRVTRTEEMTLVGGSKETHERMQETAIKFSEGLEKRGKRLPEASVREVVELLRQARERTGR